MAHFCELNENNIVLRIVAVSNSDILDENGNEDEQVGIALCNRIVGAGRWLQTSYNHSFRGQFGAIGKIYDADYDLFMNSVKPYPSWVPTDNLDWEAPIPKPEDGNFVWDEYNRVWVEE